MEKMNVCNWVLKKKLSFLFNVHADIHHYNARFIHYFIHSLFIHYYNASNLLTSLLIQGQELVSFLLYTM